MKLPRPLSFVPSFQGLVFAPSISDHVWSACQSWVPSSFPHSRPVPPRSLNVRKLQARLAARRSRPCYARIQTKDDLSMDQGLYLLDLMLFGGRTSASLGAIHIRARGEDKSSEQA
ncbi:hypothetical protein VNO77_41983 [Canavalia gladiata]|uniref:Uncharacterized protein n=1 Tax=Canavalia gladiata TaxID=3824 RepID=A0AAN9K3A5_CANGL